MSFAFGIGIGTQNKKGEWLEVFYQQPVITPDNGLIEVVQNVLEYHGGNQAVSVTPEQLKSLSDGLRQLGQMEQSTLAGKAADSRRPVVVTLLETDDTASSTPEVYLKLHLISSRQARPHELKLDGIFGLLPNLAWTSEGAIDLNELPDRQLNARIEGRTLEVKSVDKFPQMTDYVVPKGVRIADTARVRLGAYVGEGTTVMHEGFINFNAGTEGTSMIEGRISAGVMIGKGSDLGGGCSTMGTLSGGGNIIISVGENCLIGANAGIGIPLGDRCKVEAGLYITAGTKVALLDDNNDLVEVIKARDLANKPDLLFRRNSQTGAVECKTNKTAIELNEELHANN
ncbi:2,3,4,5-tetrahydropyridine-2,6-dicarboxylate N-succinyltransferase [Marinobacter panjinensis]|uniref:2,3,4,5-tetrahydropyridine-2,6-dicarboxylate N-succinyltransferase n=1 Tax=Marinobacter panjinensis TaxID=2576384 RepID=A0A4V6CWS3_9GAMM|nr:2,3,4,5-tetrahydropyridine-2,6-dicarboxylate N-succinyltransferase [Marinobacter panjinensis]MCR8915227.1 2,3,4,5-tetrahydropyridine-2,6-dicarboxylate N-succinyltransferase [Marinobacter panjinensis]TKV64445.1 2,3,4,5-tetrahydropyridine-2,6-dicarboxylate N-succinyltransferase [Marinobacter panjinensis]